MTRETGCLPMAWRRSGGRIADTGGRCATCGIEMPCGMESHGSTILCPLCHAAAHLDEAGKASAGKLIWMEELSQGEISVLSVAIFHGMAGAQPRDANADSALFDKLGTLYRMLQSRSVPLQATLAGGQPWPDMTDPSVFADQMLRRPIASERMSGLRFLPSPRAFAPLMKAWAPHIDAAIPVDRWLTMEL